MGTLPTHLYKYMHQDFKVQCSSNVHTHMYIRSQNHCKVFAKYLLILSLGPTLKQ